MLYMVGTTPFCISKFEIDTKLVALSAVFIALPGLVLYHHVKLDDLYSSQIEVSIALNSVIALVVCFTVSLVMKYTPILNMKSDATLEPNKAYEGKVATIIIPKDTPKQQLYRLSPISVLFKLVIGFVLPYGFLFSNLIWLEISALARALLWACIVAYTVGFVIYII